MMQMNYHGQDIAGALCGLDDHLYHLGQLAELCPFVFEV